MALGSRRWALVAIAIQVSCRMGFDEAAGGNDAAAGGNDAADALTVSPMTATINLGSKVVIDVLGGTPPYSMSLEGDGSLSATTFIAPSQAGQTIVHVTDTEGLTGTATIIYRGARLFLAGGLEAGAEQASVLASDDGATWSVVGQLPAARANGALVVYDDRMFYLGGLNAASAATSEVFASSDGASWTLVGSLPATNTGFTSVVYAGEMWFIGGATTNGTLAYHSKDGVTWTPAGSITGARHEHDLIVRDGRLYVLGGHGATYLDDVQVTDDGSQWTTTSAQLTFAADFAAAAAYGNTVFRVCGSGCTQTEVSVDLATWTPAAALPAAREGGVLVGFGARVLLVGGDMPVLATTDGSSWSTIGALPAARLRTSVVQFTPQ